MSLTNSLHLATLLYEQSQFLRRIGDIGSQITLSKVVLEDTIGKTCNLPNEVLELGFVALVAISALTLNSADVVDTLLNLALQLFEVDEPLNLESARIEVIFSNSSVSYIETIVDIFAGLLQECTAEVPIDTSRRLSDIKLNRSNLTCTVLNLNLGDLADVKVVVIGRVHSKVNLTCVSVGVCDVVALVEARVTSIGQLIVLKVLC